MALRPEPLAELLPLAERIVVAEVIEAVGGAAVRGEGRRLPVGASPPLPEQRVRLKVRETLRGPASEEIEALKPEAHYVLAAGHHGPFLLDASVPTPRILGRYGPDTYAIDVLRRALAPEGS